MCFEYCLCLVCSAYGTAPCLSALATKLDCRIVPVFGPMAEDDVGCLAYTKNMLDRLREITLSVDQPDQPMKEPVGGLWSAQRLAVLHDIVETPAVRLKQTKGLLGFCASRVKKS